MVANVATRLLLGLLLYAVAVTASAKPALWLVRDADTTVYLFGTVHLLPNQTDWHDALLDKALADSGSLYIELVDDDQATMTALVLRYGLDVAHPLSDKLSPAEFARLAKAATSAGVPGGLGALNAMRPWLAGLTLAVTPLLKAGLDPEHGVDKQIKALMTKAGKPVRGLETAEQQIRFLSSMPPPTELAFLRSTLDDLDKGAAHELNDIIAAWDKGDVAAIARLEDQDMRQKEPKLYQRLIVTRNKAWADKVASLLKQPGTVFIAVGAAHLAGPDSVQVQLHDRGVAVQRMQ